jgi:MoxR-like ATPase
MEPVPRRSWGIYQGTREPHDQPAPLPPPPPWRAFDGGPVVPLPAGEDNAVGRRLGVHDKTTAYRASDEVVRKVNAALYLRRALLITGKPGTGKSTLAYDVAQELRLGPVLTWSITSRSTLQEGLYHYDAIGRLQEASLRERQGDQTSTERAPDIGRYLRLGPLGTALLPRARPRVLLIDELDKSDIDLPNDLLHTFEEGEFEIAELLGVMTADGAEQMPVERGRIRCRAFPLVLITSNGEREFPPAFLRRCVRLDIKPPDRNQLVSIVAAHLGPDAVAASTPLIEAFLDARERGDLATDQLLNAIYLATSGGLAPEVTFDHLIAMLLQPLDTSGSP